MSITIGLTENRTSGVAPLSVFFDASATTSTAATFPFVELAYEWDFGDDPNAVFATTGKKKNRGFGPVASHVYETPGIYDVTLTVTDPAGTVATTTVTITVTDPDTVFSTTNTIAVSRVGDFTGAPAGATHLTTTSLATVAAQFAAGKRVLFRRGEVWPLTTGCTLNKAGPGIIGAFGSGAAPRFEMSAGSSFEPVFKISSTSSPVFSDWRIMNLDLNGLSLAGSLGIYCWGGGGPLCIYQCTIGNCDNGISAPLSQLQANNIPAMNGLCIYECLVQDANAGGGHNLVGIAAARMSMLGTELQRSVLGEHIMRCFWLQGAYINNNHYVDAPVGRHCLKIHAPLWGSSSPITHNQYTERVIISDNRIDGTGGTQIPVDLGPENSTSDERLRLCIYERNFLVCGSGAQFGTQLSGDTFAARANILNMGSKKEALTFRKKGVEPQSLNGWFSQNTCFSTGAGNPILLQIQSTVTGVYVYNNFTVGPLAVTVPAAQVPFLAGNVGNLTSTAALAGFVGGTTPVSVDDFELDPTSPAANVGDGDFATPWDFKQRAVPWGAGAPNDDLGALQISSTPPPTPVSANGLFFGFARSML